jgi:hypothetical protein
VWVTYNYPFFVVRSAVRRWQRAPLSTLRGKAAAHTPRMQLHGRSGHLE